MIILSTDGVIIFVGENISSLLGHLPVSSSSFWERITVVCHLGAHYYLISGRSIELKRGDILNVKMRTCFIVISIGFVFKSIKTNSEMKS